MQKGSLRGNLLSGRRSLDISGINLTQSLTAALYEKSDDISDYVSVMLPSKKERIETRLDSLLLGKYTSIPVMLLLFGIILWLTIAGSNYPSELLRRVFDNFEVWLSGAMAGAGAPEWCISLFAGAGVLLLMIAFSLAVTFASSKILTSTVLKGVNSAFVLELPPYRRPDFFKLMGETLKEKILFRKFQ